MGGVIVAGDVGGTKTHVALYRVVDGEFGHVSFERALSGPGLFNIYRFLRGAMGGGIAPKVVNALSDGRFICAFNDKGNMAPLLSSIDVRVSLNPAAAPVGASLLAAAML
ncbi:MAG: glucokinase [Candidatus Binataceae bacterium]